MPMSARLLRPRAAGGNFDPRSISGLVLWLDAGDTATMAQNSDGTAAVAANGDPVGYLRDKSGLGFNATQSTNNLRPTLLTSGINGRPSLSISSTADSGFRIAGSITSSASATYIFVGRYTGSASWVSLSGLPPSNSGQFLDVAQSGNATSPANLSGSPSYRVNRAAVAATRGGLFSAMNGVDYMLVVSGANLSAWSWSPSTRLFGYISPFNFIGSFAEAIMYNRNLTASELTAVESALAAKWRLP